MIPLELLSPARTARIGIAAIRCGADAVYIGGPSYGARAAAGNSIEDISMLCREASRYGVRIYVTVNTLASDDRERTEAVRMMKSMRSSGVSAFIIQDTTLLPLLAAEGEWDEEFHASTQCSIRTPQRAVQLASMGMDRLILERQLSLEQIRRIRESVPENVQLEFFVHGALCMCYSGDCYLSEFLTGRSANRGECAQPCRNLWDLVDGEGRTLVKRKPLLSLKDLDLIDRLGDLADSGIESFKIEGRLKNESYVKNVVRAYSAALDSFIAASNGKYCRASCGRVCGGFTPDLRKTFNRDYTSLLLDGRKGGWNSEQAAGALGEFIGTAVKVQGNRMTLSPARNDVEVHNGDGLCYPDRKGGICGIRVEKTDRKGGSVQITFRDVCNMVPGDKIWRNSDIAFERSLEKDLPQRMLSAVISLKIERLLPHRPEDACAAVCLSDSPVYAITAVAIREDGVKAEGRYVPDNAAEAENSGRMVAMLRSQLSRSSDGIAFSVGSIDCPDGIFPLVSSSFINSIRRNLASSLSLIPVTAKRHGTITGKLCTDAPGHPRREGELMRSSYCIRKELGMCLKDKKNPGPLFLRNNTRTFPLKFDCSCCEMAVLKP